MCVRNAISHLQVTTYQTRPPIKDLRIAHSNDRLTTTADLAHPDTTFYLLSWSGDTVASYVFEQLPKHTAVNFYLATAFSVSFFRGRRRQRRLLQTVHKVGSVSLLLTGFINFDRFPGLRLQRKQRAVSERTPAPILPTRRPTLKTSIERGQRRHQRRRRTTLKKPPIGRS